MDLTCPLEIRVHVQLLHMIETCFSLHMYMCVYVDHHAEVFNSIELRISDRGAEAPPLLQDSSARRIDSC